MKLSMHVYCYSLEVVNIRARHPDSWEGVPKGDFRSTIRSSV